MRKNIIIVFFFCFIGTAYSQDWIIDTLDNKNIYIKKGDYEAVIFDYSNCRVKFIYPEGTPQKKIEANEKRNAPWNPSIEDVEKAEILIREFLVKQDKRAKRKGAYYTTKEEWRKKHNIDKETILPAWFSDYDCHILANLDQYVRQYFGRKDKRGREILYVKFISKEEIEGLKDRLQWKKHEIVVFDGGANYWQIKVNLKRKRCFDMNVNGIGG